jgi:hypothetical protein
VLSRQGLWVEPPTLHAQHAGFEAQEMLAVAPLGNAMLAGYHTGGAPLFGTR